MPRTPIEILARRSCRRDNSGKNFAQRIWIGVAGDPRARRRGRRWRPLSSARVTAAPAIARLRGRWGRDWGPWNARRYHKWPPPERYPDCRGRRTQSWSSL